MYIWHICICLPLVVTFLEIQHQICARPVERNPLPEAKPTILQMLWVPAVWFRVPKKHVSISFIPEIWNVLCTVPVRSKKTAFQKLLFLVNFITCLAHLVTSQSYVNVLIVQGYICKNSIQEPNRFNRSTFFNGGSNPFFGKTYWTLRPVCAQEAL